MIVDLSGLLTSQGGKKMMKKVILPLVVLVLIFVLANITLRISGNMPENQVIPREVEAHISGERIEQAVVYSNFQHGWYFFDSIFGFAILLGILLSGTSGRIRNVAESWAGKMVRVRNAPLVWGLVAVLIALLFSFIAATTDHMISTGSLVLVFAWGVVGVFSGKSAKFALTTLYILFFFVLLSIISLPLYYYKSFLVEHHFELSTESFGKWFSDIIKSNMIDYLMSVLLFPLAYLVIRKMPRMWWTLVAGGTIVFLIIMMVISPVFLDPMFNKYEPLQNEQLKTRLLTMAEEAGISGGRVFQVDKSEETNKINAYVTGMFGAKRIVLWDTLLNKFSEDEIAFVMAHEMGHYVLHHIWKLVAILSAALLLLLFIISRTIQGIIRRFGDRMGFERLEDIASLPLLLLMFSLLIFLISPVFNLYSRQMEREADRFGLQLTQNTEAAVMAFVKLSGENLSNPSPHPFIEFWLYSHPALEKRIAACREFQAEVNENANSGEM